MIKAAPVLCFFLAISYWVVEAQSGGQAATEQHLARAAQALRENQPDKAIPELTAAVALDPNNVDAQGNLGVLLYFSGKPAAAEPHLRIALAAQPDLAKLRALLGQCELQTHDLQAAATDLFQALPQLNEPALRKQTGLLLVQLDKDLGRSLEAVTVAHALREQAPTDPDILYACYRVDTDLAGESLLNLSLAAGKSGQMYQAIAHELLRRRDVQGAVTNLRHAESLNEDLPGLHFELAEALQQSDDADARKQAEAEFRKALAANPKDVASMVRLADLLTEQRSEKEAEELDRRALVLQPSNEGALIGLAKVYSETGKDAEALPLLRQAVANDPSDLLGHFRLAALLRKLGKPEEAKQELATYQKLRSLKQVMEEAYSTMKLQTPTPGAGEPR